MTEKHETFAEQRKEIERLQAELKAARAPAPAAKPSTMPVGPEDIADEGVRSMHSSAKSNATNYVDSPEARAPIAAIARWPRRSRPRTTSPR